jgi:hypothetical protein
MTMSKAKSVVIVKAPFQLPEKPKVAALRLFKVGHYALTRKIPERIGNVSRRRGLGTGAEVVCNDQPNDQPLGTLKREH